MFAEPEIPTSVLEETWSENDEVVISEFGKTLLREAFAPGDKDRVISELFVAGESRRL